MAESASSVAPKPDYEEVQEGLARVRLPRGVFYNPVQQFNRDLTILILRYFCELRRAEWNVKRAKAAAKQGDVDGGDVFSSEFSGLRVLEALAASGLRSVRFAREVPHLQRIIANDVNPEAARLIMENAAHNHVSHLVEACQEDASDLMMRHRRVVDGRFDVIDLDPYGSASRYLDAAVQALSNGGLLCVTCTDAAVLTGAAAGTSFAKYGGVAYRGSSSHETGLRLLLHCIASTAARHGKVMEPLLALNIDFYFRVFVRLRDSMGGAKLGATRVALVYQCVGCDAFHLQPMAEIDVGTGRANGARGPPAQVGRECLECGGAFRVTGPFWAQELHSRATLDELLLILQKDEALARTEQQCVLGTSQRLRGMLSLAAEELPDVPLFWRLERMSRTLKCPTPRLFDVRSALLHQGYKVSGSHVSPQALKTNAPSSVMWDVLTSWAKQHAQIAPHQLEQCATLRQLLGRTAAVTPDFSPHPQAEPASRASGLLRFQKNPPNWGPKAKARREDNGLDTLEEKRAANQGKRRRNLRSASSLANETDARRQVAKFDVVMDE